MEGKEALPSAPVFVDRFAAKLRTLLLDPSTRFSNLVFNLRMRNISGELYITVGQFDRLHILEVKKL